MRDFLRVLLTPSCWPQFHSYSDAWDKRLRQLLETESFTDIKMHTAKIGGHEVWIANHPYASFSLHQHPQVRPSRAVILRAGDKLVADTLAKGAK